MEGIAGAYMPADCLNQLIHIEAFKLPFERLRKSLDVAIGNST
jgi:hypothetical protein